MKKNIKKKEILDVWFVNETWLHAEVRFKGHKFLLYASSAKEDHYLSGHVALRLLVVDMESNPFHLEIGKVDPHMSLRRWRKFVRGWLANHVGRNFRICH